MPLYLGNTQIQKAYVGTQEIDRAYLGSIEVFSGLTAVNLTPPSIAGIGYTGQTLTATSGAWQDETSVSGQWYADGSPIAGATSLTYLISEANEGADFQYIETAQPGSVNANSNNIHNWIITDMVSATPVVWYNFNHTSTITDVGGFVDQWDDLTPNGLFIDAQAPANRPILNVDHIAFAASHALDRGSIPAFMDGTGENWAFVAHNLRAGATLGDDPILLANNTSGSNNAARRPYIQYNDAQDEIRYHASNGDSVYNIGADTGWNIIGGANTDTTELLRVGGLTRDTGTGADTDPTHGFFTIGAIVSNANLLGTLDIRGAVYGLGPISTADIERVEGMMAWMHDTVAKLDAGHPYKSAPPTI